MGHGGRVVALSFICRGLDCRGFDSQWECLYLLFCLTCHNAGLWSSFFLPLESVFFSRTMGGCGDVKEKFDPEGHWRGYPFGQCVQGGWRVAHLRLSMPTSLVCEVEGLVDREAFGQCRHR